MANPIINQVDPTYFTEHSNLYIFFALTRCMTYMKLMERNNQSITFINPPSTSDICILQHYF